MNKRQIDVMKANLKSEEEVIQELKGAYAQALDDINQKIVRLMSGDAITQSKIYQIEYQQALSKQVSAILDMMNSNQYDKIDAYLKQCYEDGYLGTMYDINGQGIPLILPIDQDQAVKAIQLDSKISESMYEHLGKDVAELKNQISAEIARGISTNATYTDIARNLAGVSGIGFNKSARIARTEGHRITAQATHNAQQKAVEKGADVVKQWDATLDKKTRPSHRELDGQIREVDEPFTFNGHEAQHPCGFGVASLDINCRCVLLQRARWGLDDSFTKWNGETQELMDFQSADNYQDYKKSYFSPENIQYMNFTDGIMNKYHTGDIAKAIDKMTDAEYEAYKELLKNAKF